MKNPLFDFQIKSRCKSTLARVCSIKTPNGFVNTPRFMPVGTLGTVKGVTANQLKKTGAEMILANTFHLHLQPGEKIIKDAGGLHKFMSWNKPILTDSGGYQVFSLAKLNKIDDEGVSFQNPRDGKMNKFKEENALLTQAWVMEPKKKVQDVIKELAINDLKIKEFSRIKIGE